MADNTPRAEWRPISEALKNRMEVWLSNSTTVIGPCRWSKTARTEGWRHVSGGYRVLIQPTHWMPYFKPEPPHD